MSDELTRRGFLTGTAATVAGAAMAGEAGRREKTAERKPPEGSAGRPNVLWICTDQQRYDTIRALGNPYLRTPNLDRLVQTGVAFTHAHCQAPICTPSRASFLTGMYPDTVHGCINGNDHWDDAAPLITKTLSDAGYDCGLAGKLHLSCAQGRIEKRPDDGYRVFHWSHHPTPDWPEGHAYDEWLRRAGHDYRAIHKRHGFIPAPLHQTTWKPTRANSRTCGTTRRRPTCGSTCSPRASTPPPRPSTSAPSGQAGTSPPVRVVDPVERPDRPSPSAGVWGPR